MNKAGWIFIIGHCAMAGIAFAVLEWYDGVVGLIPFLSQIYLGIRFITTDHILLGIICFSLLVMIVTVYIISSIRARRAIKILKEWSDEHEQAQ